MLLSMLMIDCSQWNRCGEDCSAGGGRGWLQTESARWNSGLVTSASSNKPGGRQGRHNQAGEGKTSLAVVLHCITSALPSFCSPSLLTCCMIVRKRKSQETQPRKPCSGSHKRTSCPLLLAACLTICCTTLYCLPAKFLMGVGVLKSSVNDTSQTRQLKVVRLIQLWSSSVTNTHCSQE